MRIAAVMRHSNSACQSAKSTDQKANIRRARIAFSTRAYAQFLEALGWQLAASIRHDVEQHARLQFCLLLQDGQRQEAGFGYTGLTAPHDVSCPDLARAKVRIERVLGRIDAQSGVLFQNTPLFAFDSHRKDRMAIFGGWRFHQGAWSPFLVAPGGFCVVGDQGLFFDSASKPSVLAAICGHNARDVMPHASALVRAVENIDRPREASSAKLAADPLRFEPFKGGWFVGRIRPHGEDTSTWSSHAKALSVASGSPQPLESVFDAECDTFRFRTFGSEGG